MTQLIVMEKGFIVQIGSPHEIYFKPSNLYVASLFGEINIFESEVIDNYCLTPLGAIKSTNIPNNQKVNIVISLRQLN